MDIHQYNNPRARRLLLLYTPFLNPTAGILDDEREDGSRSRDALDRETLKSEIASVKQLCRVHSDYCEEHASTEKRIPSNEVIIESSSVPTATLHSNASTERIRTLISKSRVLEEEVAALRSKQRSGDGWLRNAKEETPNDWEVRNSIDSETTRSGELCVYLREQLRLLEEEHTALVQAQNQHTIIRRVFQAKIEDKKKESNEAGSSTETRLRDRSARLESVIGQLEDAMDAFLAQHYPPPEIYAMIYACFTYVYHSEQTPNRTGPKLLDLQDIVHTLMNLCVTSPSQPYIEIDDSVHWPPYIELLLRSGVAEKHPQDKRRVRLVRFHR